MGKRKKRRPLGGRLKYVALGLFRRLRWNWFAQRYTATPVLAAFSFFNGTLSIGLLATVAHFTGSAFIFPSLGPTAFLLFYDPTATSSSPRNTLFGHLIGAVAGWFSLALFGLLDAPSALATGVDWPRVGAAALSLGSTSGLMVLFRVAHPPAGATTLIVSLGLMPHLWQIPILMAAVVLLTGQAFVTNRLAGLRYPLWGPVQDE